MTAKQRKNIILAFLERLNKGVTAKCLQKYLFIFTRMQSGDKIYDFVPYKYGCFSFQANQDIVSLERDGYIAITDCEDSDKEYSLLHDAQAYRYLDMFEKQLVDDVCSTYGKMSQDQLIAYTYRRWPFTAINSVVKEKLLTKEELEKVDEQKKRFADDTPMLFTIGYEGFTLESYLRRLITNDVRVLVDVRKNAYSRKYGFSKNILQKGCEGVGIKYIHIPQLGIDSSKRQTLETQHDYDVLFDEYERTTLVENWSYLLELKSIVDANVRVCLTCFEKDPRQCHRTHIAHALMDIPDHEYKFSELLL